MAQETPTFNIGDFELRNYTQPWLTPAQQEEVTDTEDRVNSQLDFLAQMLGWNGPNYWGNLPETPNQKRQLLGGSFGVYNSYIIPEIVEVRNWEDAILIKPRPDFRLDSAANIARVVLGQNEYTVESVEKDGENILITFSDLDSDFYSDLEANEPLKLDIPISRPAPFYRPSVGASADAAFACKEVDGALALFPSYDEQGQFEYKFPCLFAGSVYYFNQPVYLAKEDTLEPFVEPTYDVDKNVWFFKVPDSNEDPIGINAYLVWAHSGASQDQNLSLTVSIQNWTDPSDWGATNVLNNFTGAWGNKGGELPFHLVFDSLDIHGFNEANSVYFGDVASSIDFDDIVNYIYYQKIDVSPLGPPGPKEGDLWWNDNGGALSVWFSGNAGCGQWVEVDYRSSLRQGPLPSVVYPDVATFRAESPSLPGSAIVEIQDFNGLEISDNVIGIQGTIQTSGSIVIHKVAGSQYWEVDSIRFSTVSNFEANAMKLPYKIPVRISNGTGLQPQGLTYSVRNLPITVGGNYEVLIVKYYENTNWEIYPDSFLKYIAASSLFSGPQLGETWWDFSFPDAASRAAEVYYGTYGWVNLNENPPNNVPPITFNPNVILFYCDGELVKRSVACVTDDYMFTYNQSSATGKYSFTYRPLTPSGKLKLPTITISDSITTTYRADITDLVFSGTNYSMSPNVYDSETPLRLWKSQALQVAETEAHIEEDNYINPLVADLNNGPGSDNWEKYFIRLPLDYERNGAEWQKVALACQNFAYFGTSLDPERMDCPPEDDTPIIWEELFIYDTPIKDFTYVYYEDYLYSNIAYYSSDEDGPYINSGVFPAVEVKFDEFEEANLVDYDPLHNRQADVTSPVGDGYGDWLGGYVNVSPCTALSGYVYTDLLSGAITPVAAPEWDASIYKFPPTCEGNASSFNVDVNHFKIGYAYFVADASAAEDGFFDVAQEAAWRYPVNQPKTLYMTPR
jgi:hypothetical protein